MDEQAFRSSGSIAVFREEYPQGIHKFGLFCSVPREQALQRMTKDAERLGADAVVGLSFSTSMIAQGAAEILDYGTAVKLK